MGDRVVEGAGFVHLVEVRVQRLVERGQGVEVTRGLDGRVGEEVLREGKGVSWVDLVREGIAEEIWTEFLDRLFTRSCFNDFLSLLLLQI